MSAVLFANSTTRSTKMTRYDEPPPEFNVESLAQVRHPCARAAACIAGASCHHHESLAQVRHPCARRSLHHRCKLPPSTLKSGARGWGCVCACARKVARGTNTKNALSLRGAKVDGWGGRAPMSAGMRTDVGISEFSFRIITVLVTVLIRKCRFGHSSR